MKIFYTFFFLLMITGCDQLSTEAVGKPQDSLVVKDSVPIPPVALKDTPTIPDSVRIPIVTQEVTTGDVYADSVVTFAETLKGTPYKYASTDPAVGFDCSGFITYVFNKFNINVPRSSKDFENVGDPVMLLGARRGDIILFTGTDSTDSTIGHMGIITSNSNGDVRFIHSTSGKAYGVTESLLDKYYMKRYVKTLRVFNH